jgi:hypothetical protein
MVEIPLDTTPRSESVAILTPTKSGFANGYVRSVIDLTHAMAAKQMSWRWFEVNDGPLVQGRDSCAHVWLEESPCTHSLWLDGDNGISPEVLFKLLDLKVDFAIAPYLQRRSEQRAFTILGDFDWDQTPVNNAVEVSECGFGTLLIRRSVFERLAPAQPQYRNFGKIVRNHFGEVVDTKTLDWVSEDVGFCRRWRATGGKIWAHLDCETWHDNRVGHFGREFWESGRELRRMRAKACADVTEAVAAKAELQKAIARARGRGVDVRPLVAPDGFASVKVEPITASGFEGAACARTSTIARSYTERACAIRAQLDSMRAAEAAE